MSGAAAPAEPTDAAADRAWKPKTNPWLIAVVVTLAAFMEILDTTIVNVSLPHIAGTVSASYDDATWVLTSYLVANGIVLPISGWLGRLLGRKRYFLICIAMFTVCSFLCGIATDLAQLVIFRLAQGFFGGGLQPNQQSVILDTFEPAQRGRAFSVVAIAVIFAPVIGPTLGGWITDNYSWRWIFLINVPVGLLAFFCVNALVEDPPWVKRQTGKDKRIDFIGIGLIAVGIGCLQVMLDRGEDDDWFGSPMIVTFACLAFVGITGAVTWLLYARRPVVNLRVFADRNFAVGCVVISAFGAILYSSSVLIPQLAQQQLGYTALLAGLVLSPGAVIIVLLIPIVTRFLLPKIQTRYIIAFGFLLLGTSLSVAHELLTPNIDYNTLAILRVLQAAGLAFLFVPNSTIAYSTTPRELNGDASAMFTMLRNISGSIGISMSTAFITQRSQAHRAYLVDHLTPFDKNYQALVASNTHALQSLGHAPGSITQTAQGLVNQTLASQAAILGYMDVFAYCAIAAFCIVPLTFLFSPSVASGRAPAAAH